MAATPIPAATTTPTPTSLELAIQELRTGPLSILSDKALDRIIVLMQNIADERWNAGYAICERNARVTKAP